jgi:hypothetical protein
MKRYVLAAVLAVSVFGATAIIGNTAEAKRPPRATEAASLTVNETAPRLNSVVTFAYSGVTNDCGKNYGPRCLRVELVCSQAATAVYMGDANADQQFLLGGGISQWVTNGGSADCVATLYYYSSYNPVTRVNLATSSFAAGG